MTHNHNLWETRPLRGDLPLELHAGDDPALVLAQRENRVRVELHLQVGPWATRQRIWNSTNCRLPGYWLPWPLAVRS